MNQNPTKDYQAALEGCVFRPLRGTGPIFVRGEDRISFLQRQSTNDLSKLKPNGMLSTVLTNPSARIIDVLRIINLQDEAFGTLLALTLPGGLETTFPYLKSRIFFMDKVSLEDHSASFTHIELDGPRGASVLATVGLGQLPEENTLTAFEHENGSVYCYTRPGLTGSGYTLLAPAASAGSLLEKLQGAGAVRLQEDTAEILRVEAGLPGSGSELSDDYTPLETGLKDLISDTKGCYTGQEVIARQITYDKITQTLCGLRFDEPAEAGVRLWGEGKLAGSLTSCVHSPRFGHIGLGIIKRPHNQPGTILQVGAPDGNKVVEVCALPFARRDQDGS